MANEIELKLSIDPAAIPSLRRHPLLNSAKSTRRHLRNTYYDTANLQLRALGVALRFRQIGDQWLLTLKSGNPAAGGFAERNEWECPAKPGVFDFAHVGDPVLRHFLEAHVAQLRPVFTTDFTREAWQVEYAGSRIEVALDQGLVASEGRETPLCEVELELLSGNDGGALFSLALELSDATRLHPEIASKAERGYRLFRQEARHPVYAMPSALQSWMDAPTAFVSLAHQCLRQLQANEAGVLDETAVTPEFVHQARIAIRRLRSAIDFFAPLLPRVFRDRYSPAWRNVGIALAAARDWEVMRYETLPTLGALDNGPAAAGLRDRLEAGIEQTLGRAREQSCAALLHPGYSRLLLEFSAALHALQHPLAPASTQSANLRSLTDHVLARLKRAARVAKKRAAAVTKNRPEKLNAQQMHRLRIAVKKLRYGLEFARPLLPEPATSSYREALSRLQETLGKLNDLNTAEQLLAEYTSPDELAAIYRATSERRHHHRRLLRQHWAAFRHAARPWQGE
jgi:triphosphatase